MMGGHGGEDRKAAKHALDDDVSDVTPHHPASNSARRLLK